MNSFKSLLAIFCAIVLLIGCEEKDPLSLNNVESFVFEALNTTGNINQEENSIEIYVPNGTDLSDLTPTIQVSEGAIVEPASGQSNNFKNPAAYSVTAENGSLNIYTVYVKLINNNIQTFSLLDQLGTMGADNTITFNFPFGTEITNLTPTITFDENATIEPAADSPQDFTAPVTYTLTAENGDKNTYTVKVNVAAGSDANELLSFHIKELFADGVIESNQISLQLPYGTDQSQYLDLQHLTVEAEVSEHASIDATLNSFDLSTKEITVTSQSGLTNTYSLNVEIEEENPEAIRGVWLTNVASNAMASPENIEEAVNRIDELGFNTIFAVTYNKFQTLHPSQVLKDLYTAGEQADRSTQFYYETADNGFDPLQILIEKAHAKGIKVVAWFEYGFAYKYGGVNTDTDWFYNFKPDWFAKDRNGDIANKNNFYWLNGFHPEVQQFMIDLIVEVVQKYDVDGIQGDDRLPALPNTSGHSAYTLQRYADEHNGATPPASDTEQSWLKWRADILTQFGVDLYNAVKSADPNCLVTFSPSAYNFSYYNYLQDWPEWINKGIVDIVSPQLYRYEDAGFEAYSYLLNSHITTASGLAKKQFAPGVLIAAGGYIPTDEYLARLIKYNRSQGIMGEVHFFYEALYPKRNVFHALYPVKPQFPQLNQ
ncbi:family 10 glycosylhydrolase [Limibacter armeniacum]|uniref:family 10 glycosylhydrolase n=1 Tax=Limibacter armeniacum TaxID=466084 RepID=UPI002FE5F9A9